MSKRVLVVDDDEFILDAVSLLLQAEGFSILTLLQGDQVVETARTWQPDVILLDILISGTDGRDICRQLKAETGLQHIPVLLVSAHPNVAETTQHCGAENFLAKPFERQQLLQAMAEVMA